MMSYDYPHPVSRTYQYKKITKPLLERKRRARINRCLDELKDLMIDALETEGEDISKLEKADILELTVRHLRRLQASRSPSGLPNTITSNDNNDGSAENRWLSGFGHCAAEACRFLSALPGEAAERLARHLAAGLQTNRQTNPAAKTITPTLTLADLDRTAGLVSPGTPSPGVDAPGGAAGRKIPPQSNPSTHGEINSEEITKAEFKAVLFGGDEKSRMDPSNETKSSRDHQVSTKMKTEVDTNEEEEEIDVERVDEADPMWRPWSRSEKLSCRLNNESKDASNC